MKKYIFWNLPLTFLIKETLLFKIMVILKMFYFGVINGLGLFRFVLCETD